LEPAQRVSFDPACWPSIQESIIDRLTVRIVSTEWGRSTLQIRRDRSFTADFFRHTFTVTKTTRPDRHIFVHVAFPQVIASRSQCLWYENAECVSAAEALGASALRAGSPYT
jgi:hypothetical protein